MAMAIDKQYGNTTANTSASTTVAAHFNKRSDAEGAVEELKDAGFRADQISLAVRPAYGAGSSTGYQAGGSTAYKTGAGKADHDEESFWTKVKDFFEGHEDNHEDNTDSAKSGAGLASGSIKDGARVVAASESDPYGYDYDREGFHGSLTSMSIPPDRATYFSRRFGAGNEGAVVVVRAAGREKEAESILKNNNGDLGANAASYDAASESGNESVAGTQRIQLLGEVLRVHKERIQRGEVRLHKEVVTDQQTIQVPVEREELVVERVAVDGKTPASGIIGKDQDIRIPLSEERVRVDKQNVVREEVNVGKKVVTSTQKVSDQVRHEELRVEKDGKSKVEQLDPKTRRSA